MKLFKLIFSISLIFTIVGCVSVQPPIPMSNTVFEDSNKRVGLLYTDKPIAETAYTGSIGLLDYAIISGANSGLDDHLATLEFPEYDEFIELISNKLKTKNITLVVIEDTLTSESANNLKSPSEGISKNDFSSYQDTHNLDMLMLLEFKSIGTTRSYYGFIPTTEPLAQSYIRGQLVDLSSNKLLWFTDTITTKPIPTPWDESNANFPNLTSSVYKALDESLRLISYEIEGNKKLNIVSHKTTENK